MDNEQTEKLLHLIGRISNAEEKKANALESISRLANIAYYIVCGSIILIIGTIVIGLSD